MTDPGTPTFKTAQLAFQFKGLYRDAFWDGYHCCVGGGLRKDVPTELPEKLRHRTGILEAYKRTWLSGFEARVDEERGGQWK